MADRAIQTAKLERSIGAVIRWVEARHYRGHDPADGNASPLRYLTFGRVLPRRILQQAVLRAPFNIRPWVGINGKYVEKDSLAILNVPLTEGFLIETVEPGSPAQKAGLRGGELPVMIAGLEILLGGDIITHINEMAIDSPEMIVKIYRSLKVGQKIALTYFRMGKKMKAEFIISERPILPSDLLSGASSGLMPQSKRLRPVLLLSW